MYIIAYTITASLPFLIALIAYYVKTGNLHLNGLAPLAVSDTELRNFGNMQLICMTLAFLVKIPI